jgi:AcrR family transcriptional regulator
LNPRSDLRRRRILQAFHDCVIEKGYSKVALADIARAADMAPSHLLYYFRGKDAMLEHYFQDVATRINERIDRFRGESPERQLELLGELFFTGRTVTRSEIGLMHECFGIAVHDTQLKRIKTEFDARTKGYLADLFRQLPGRSLFRAQDAAEVAYAILFGLRTAVFFDDDLDQKRALQVFKDSIHDLCGSTR